MTKIIKASVCLIMLLCVVSVKNISAATVESENRVYMLYSGKDKRYTVKSYFDSGHKIQAGEKYSLAKGKYVKQAYVRARSDGSKMCGSYDSQRAYSLKAPSKKRCLYATPEKGTKQCFFCTQRLNYGWVYF